jgi:hypothetical protein
MLCAGCSSPPRVECVNRETGIKLAGIAIRELGTGQTAYYELRDANDLPGKIDASNSAQWACRRVG